MPATAQVADGAMDEGRIVLWMGDGYFGRCQIDESKVLVECRQDHGTRCPSKRVPSATLTLFHPPWSSPSSTNHPRHRSHTQYTSLCCFHITAPTTASIPSSARLVSPAQRIQRNVVMTLSPTPRLTSHVQQSRLEACWREQNCSSCVRSPHGCGWCAQVCLKPSRASRLSRSPYAVLSRCCYRKRSAATVATTSAECLSTACQHSWSSSGQLC